MTCGARDHQQGFTLIEIIAVLLLLGILAAVALPKFMDLTLTAKEKAAMGQIGEVKGRLNTALNGYMMANSGNRPTGAQLITYINTVTANSCPAPPGVNEGDFTFECSAVGNVVTVTVTNVQGSALTANNTGTFITQ